MTFERMIEQATHTANLTLASKDQKEDIRNNIVDLIALACTQYESDTTFKADINRYLRWRRNNISLKEEPKCPNN